MNIESYKKQLIQKKMDYEKDINALAVEFVLSNNTIKKGDIITDHIGSIRVEKIMVTLSFGRDDPRAVYKGDTLTKKLIPLKRPKERTVHEVNIK